MPNYHYILEKKIVIRVKQILHLSIAVMSTYNQVCVQKTNKKKTAMYISLRSLHVVKQQMC